MPRALQNICIFDWKILALTYASQIIKNMIIHISLPTSIAWWLSNDPVLSNQLSQQNWTKGTWVSLKYFAWNYFAFSSHNWTLFLEITNSTWSVFCLQNNIGEKLSLEIFSIKFSWLLYSTVVPLNLCPK